METRSRAQCRGPGPASFHSGGNIGFSEVEPRCLQRSVLGCCEVGIAEVFEFMSVTIPGVIYIESSVGAWENISLVTSVGKASFGSTGEYSTPSQATPPDTLCLNIHWRFNRTTAIIHNLRKQKHGSTHEGPWRRGKSLSFTIGRIVRFPWKHYWNEFVHHLIHLVWYKGLARLEVSSKFNLFPFRPLLFRCP